MLIIVTRKDILIFLYEDTCLSERCFVFPRKLISLPKKYTISQFAFMEIYLDAQAIRVRKNRPLIGNVDIYIFVLVLPDLKST